MGSSLQLLLKGPKSAQDTPRPNSQHKGDLIVPEGQRVGSKRQSQKTHDEREEGKGVRERVICLRGSKEGLPLGKEERNMTHRQMSFYQGERGNPVLG